MRALVALPLLFAANWFFWAMRHEAAHAAVIGAAGGRVTQLRLWPPEAATLSSLSFELPEGAGAWLVPAQAFAPYAVALILLAAGLFACLRLEPGFLRANVVVTAVVFPLAELDLAAWALCSQGGGDLSWCFGTGPGARGLVATVAGILTFIAIGVVWKTVFAAGAPAGGGSHGAG